MANPFVHVELQTRDLTRAKDFYSRLFGWKLEDRPAPGGEGSYTLIQVGEGTGGGMFTHPDPNCRPSWLPYVGVEDIAASIARARELGAQIVVDCMQIGDVGSMSAFVDPTGATLAVWQSRQRT